MTFKTRFKEWFASLFYMREGYVVRLRTKTTDGEHLYLSRDEAIGAARSCLRFSLVEYTTVEAVFSGHPPIIIYDSRRDA